MTKNFFGTPLIVSNHGAGLDELTWYIHILMAVLFVGWAGYFIHALIKFRASSSPKADHVGVRNHLSTWVEIGVAVFTLILGMVVIIDSRRVGSGWAEDGPQAGYFPYYIGIFLCLASAWTIWPTLTW